MKNCNNNISSTEAKKLKLTEELENSLNSIPIYQNNEQTLNDTVNAFTNVDAIFAELDKFDSYSDIDSIESKVGKSIETNHKVIEYENSENTIKPSSSEVGKVNKSNYDNKLNSSTKINNSFAKDSNCVQTITDRSNKNFDVNILDQFENCKISDINKIGNVTSSKTIEMNNANRDLEFEKSYNSLENELINTLPITQELVYVQASASYPDTTPQIAPHSLSLDDNPKNYQETNVKLDDSNVNSSKINSSVLSSTEIQHDNKQIFNRFRTPNGPKLSSSCFPSQEGYDINTIAFSSEEKKFAADIIQNCQNNNKDVLNIINHKRGSVIADHKNNIQNYKIKDRYAMTNLTVQLTNNMKIKLADIDFIKQTGIYIDSLGYLVYYFNMEEIDFDTVEIYGYIYINHENIKPVVFQIKNVPHILYLKVTNEEKFFKQNALSVDCEIIDLLSNSAKTNKDKIKFKRLFNFLTNREELYVFIECLRLNVIELFGNNFEEKKFLNKQLQSEFTEIYGLNNKPTETILTSKYLGSPCWVFFECRSNIIDYSETKFHTLTSDFIPNFSLLCIETNCIMNNSDNKTKYSYIIISCAYYSQAKNINVALELDNTKTLDHKLFIYMDPNKYSSLYNLELLNAKNYNIFYKTPKELLNSFVDYIAIVNPDIIFGTNIEAKTFKLIENLANTTTTKVEYNFVINKLRRSTTRKTFLNYNDFFFGRLHCDLSNIVKDFVPGLNDYSFKSLVNEVMGNNFAKYLLDDIEIECSLTVLNEIFLLKQDSLNSPLDKALLNKTICEYDYLNCYTTFESTDEYDFYGKFLHVLQNQSILNFQLLAHYEVVPICFQIAETSNSPISYSLLLRRAARNELLLLREFLGRNLLIPDRKSNINSTSSTTYSGGLVLEPKVGLYNTYVIYLDFASLYPSIVQEYNLDFTTMSHLNKVDLIEIMSTLNKKPKGILPLILESLVNKRKVIKNKLKQCSILDNNLKKLLDIKQKAIKLIANSLYGSLGFSQFRFYFPVIASTITALGRQTLSNTKAIIEQKYKYNILYGDTDSLMIDTTIPHNKLTEHDDYKKIIATSHMLINEINRQYNTIELEIEGVFIRLYLVNKKKYAGLFLLNNMTTKIQIRGLEIVRRDWCNLFKNTGYEIIYKILDCDLDKTELTNSITNIINTAREELISCKDISNYIIRKTITKQISEYNNINQIPHIAVAIKLRDNGIMIYQGMLIQYIITDINGPLWEKAIHVSELIKNKSVKPDIFYYKHNQLYAPLLRLLKHIYPEMLLNNIFKLTTKINNTFSNTTADTILQLDNVIQLLQKMRFDATIDVIPDFPCNTCTNSIKVDNKLICSQCNTSLTVDQLLLYLSNLSKVDTKAVNNVLATCEECGTAQQLSDNCIECKLPLLLEHSSIQQCKNTIACINKLIIDSRNDPESKLYIILDKLIKIRNDAIKNMPKFFIDFTQISNIIY